jgi:hypothetical protein
MILSTHNNTITIRQEKQSVLELITGIKAQYDQLKHHNFVVHLSSLKELDENDLLPFLQVSNAHKAAKRSFVIVATQMSMAKLDQDLTVVPSLKEAYDLIEMEEIERDLGF